MIFIPFEGQIYSKKGSHVSLLFVTFSIIFPCLSKLKILLLTLTWKTSSTFNVCMKTLNELCNSDNLTSFSYTLFTKLYYCFTFFFVKTFIYRRVNTSKILYGATIPVTLTKNQFQYLFILLRKSCLPVKLSAACPQEKSCLPNWFRIFHMLVEKMLLPVACNRVGI